MDEELVIHTRAATQVWDVLSDFGGLFDIFYIGLFILIGMLNDKLLIDKVINDLYRTRTKETAASILQEVIPNAKVNIKRAFTGSGKSKVISFKDLNLKFFDKIICCQKTLSAKKKKYLRGL